MAAPTAAARALRPALGLPLRVRRLALDLRRPFHPRLVLHAAAALEALGALAAHLGRRGAPDLTLRCIAAPRAPLLRRALRVLEALAVATRNLQRRFLALDVHKRAPRLEAAGLLALGRHAMR